MEVSELLCSERQCQTTCAHLLPEMLRRQGYHESVMNQQHVQFSIKPEKICCLYFSALHCSPKQSYSRLSPLNSVDIEGCNST